MIVAREGRGREVLHAVLYPLHRHTQHDRADDGADVAWIDADLVAEAAADVRRDDVDLVLGNARQQRGHGTHHRSEEHTSELQSLMRISYAVFCLKKNTNTTLH